jgi:adenylate cyclase
MQPEARPMHTCLLRSASPPAAELSGAELVERTRRRLIRAAWSAGLAGSVAVFFVIGFLIPVFADPGDRAELAFFNAPLIVAYLVTVGLLLQLGSTRYLRRTLAWLVEDRHPDEREHRATLRLAMHSVKWDAAGWIGGAILFTLLNGFIHSWGFAAVVGATIWLGGETTCALLYLVNERVLRPVTACALTVRPADRSVAPDVRGRLAMAWLLGTGVPLLGVLVVAAAGLWKSGADLEYVTAAILFLGALATVVGMLATLFAAKAIAEPLTGVRDALERITRGDLDAQVAVDDGSEVGLVQAGFNRMAEGLRERERIRDLFGKQVGEDVARAALSRGARLGGEEREVAALFIDMVGSTSMALALPPHEVVRLLNRFFRLVVDAVEAEGGFVNKFEGDAALCVFGAPVTRDDPAGDALRAARRLTERLLAELPEIDFGIGVSAGAAVAGNVGAEKRFEYTVIGDPVNEAARIAELAKQRPDRVLASDAALTRSSEFEREVWVTTESALLRGRGAPTAVARPRTDPLG